MNTQEINKFLEQLRRQPIDMGDMDLLLQLIKQHDYKFDKDDVVEIYTRTLHPKNGFFLTPNRIAELISVITQIYNPKSVIDICCGVGNILSYFKNLETIKGLDVNKSSIQLAEYINPNSDFSVANALEYNFGNEKYDLVVGQPPFNARMSDRRLLDIELIKKGLELLNDNGVGIFIVAIGLLFRGTETEFRQQLLSDFSLDMVINVPSGIFSPYTGIPTAILVVRNGKKKQDIFMPIFENNATEIVDNFTDHKGNFYLGRNEISSDCNLSIYHYLAQADIEKTLKGHNVKKLAELASIFYGKNIKTEYESHGKYLVFNQKDKDNNERFVSNIVDENLILKCNDIVIGLIGENPKIYFHKDDSKAIVIKNDYAIIRPYSEHLNAYLKTEEGKILLENQIRLQIKPNIAGTIPRLKASSLKDFSIPILSYQEIIERFLNEKQNLISQVNIFIGKKEYDSAREYVEKYFEKSSENSEHKSVYLKNIENAKELSSKLQERELLIKENKALQNRMQKLVEQFTHSLGNVIFPDTIYQVAERWKNNPECRKDVLLLHEAYHSEITIKLQGELLRQRHTNTDPKKFRFLIMRCRSTPNNANNTKSIEDILDYAASRVTARFLNQHYAGLNTIRDKILAKKGVDINALKQKFEDDILLNKSLRPIAWINENLRPVQIAEISPLWKKVCILAESHAEALLFGYFSEILFNAFKYADHDKDEFLTLVFNESVINDKTYLACSWKNPVKDKTPLLGTGKGLDAIQEDLKQLNDTENPEQSLLVQQQNNQFQVTLFFNKDLLIDDLPILTRKRKTIEANHA